MRLGHILQRFGVGQQGDVDLVAGTAGLAAQAAQLALFARMLFQPRAVVTQVVGLRVDRDAAVGAVDDQHVAIGDAAEQLRYVDDQRQVQAACQDRTVRQRAAGGGDDADHALCLQLRQLGRGDVVADQDLAGQALHHRRALGLQEGVDAADHMVQVVHAALQVGSVHAIEDPGQAVALQAQRIAGAVRAAADQFVQAIQQLGVVQQQRVQV
ncbi:hypothetical protein G6F22_015309 [Rhizopus arrhizus]|nr:hypothetical protein G6F22_015309 [Rhizopus arrhizus]